MVEIYIKGNRYVLPDCWEELSADQYLDVMKVLNLKVDENLIDYEIARAKQILIKKWTGMRSLDFLGWTWVSFFRRDKRLLNEFLVRQWSSDLMPALEFLFDGTNFSVNPLPHFDFKYRTYYGPGARLFNVSGAELEAAWIFSGAYDATEDDKFLLLLTATLYRPQDAEYSKHNSQFFDDRRSKFVDAEIQHRADALKGINPAILRGVKLFFDNCISFYKEQYNDVFSGGGTGDFHLDDYRRLMRSLAGIKRGNVEQVKLMNTGDIFFELQCLELERQAQEKAMKK